MKHMILAKTLPIFLILTGPVCAGRAAGQLGGFLEKVRTQVAAVRGESETATPTLDVQSGELPLAGREIGELATPKSLLEDSPALRKLLGDNPVFVYNPNNRPDPMLIPWTRSKVMFTELSEIAAQATEQKNWQMAEMAYRRMLGLDSADHRQMAEDGLANLATLVAQEEEVHALASGKPLEAKLPPWISGNTNGVIIDSEQPMCLVGAFILKQGDLVPRQPVDVLVTKINSDSVHYTVLDKTFIVPIREGE